MPQPIRLFTYKQTHDTGFAPNPFHGFCTLVTCKAGMRRTKRVGDWIAGFTSERVSKGRDPIGQERLIYLMQVSEVLPMACYFTDTRFAVKQASHPKESAAPCIASIGDNIYEYRDGDWIQHPNRSHDESERDADLSGKNALIAEEFYYFGIDALVIPDEFRPRIPIFQANYGWRTTDQAIVRGFLDFVWARGRGVHAQPHTWKTGDNSWKQS